MSDETAQRRPIGWWLKEADGRIEAAFDGALEGTGVDRRTWQVLTSLGRGPMSLEALAAALGSFDGYATVAGLVDRLRAEGLLDAADGVLRLTAAGIEQERALAPLVDGVRRRVAGALPGDDYATLVSLLARLVDALGDETPSTPSATGPT